ncbi:D-glyceraldehyde dehydrogenase [Candidatus Marsarchaeota archaeon]|nr:D-glyceraldehyde dehydrogenase [Candidatus Marsarchaeota archaeon]
MGENVRMLINGEWRDSEKEDTLVKYEPSTGKVLYKFPAATKNDAKEAIDAASDSWERWNSLGSVKRASVLYKARDIIARERSELEKILLTENGKVAKEAKEEVEGVLDQFLYYAEFSRKITGDVVEGESKKRKILQYKVPCGVAAAITPWNFPAAMVARKLAPALLTGNSVVLKPSSDTPGSAEFIVKALVEAGVPRGVVNLITGRGAEIGDYISSNEKVGVITMTGSTITGQRIMEKASKNMAKLVLELGGKAPFMVWKDANIANAAKTFVWAKYWNAGQSCIAAERLYVHEDVYDRFMNAIIAATKKLKVGNPRKADIGPLINKSAVEGVMSFVDYAKKEGYKIKLGGGESKLNGALRGGYFFQPTIIGDVDQKSKLFREEIFGPVIGAAKVNSIDELFSKANDSKYGLASYLFTEDYRLMMRAAEEIRFGELYINMPGPEASQGYHTGFRLTGQGGEGSKYGVMEYLKLKNVYIDYSQD